MSWGKNYRMVWECLAQGIFWECLAQGMFWGKV